MPVVYEIFTFNKTFNIEALWAIAPFFFQKFLYNESKSDFKKKSVHINEDRCFKN